MAVPEVGPPTVLDHDATMAATFWRGLAAGLKRQDYGSPALIQRDHPKPLFRDFIRDAWKVLEPATVFSDNWHIHAIADHLEAVTDAQIQHLLITMPPRHMKSILVAVLWPTWVWTWRPWTRWLFASYAQGLSTRDSLKCRRVIRSPWYRGNWGHLFELSGDQNVKTRFENDATGVRIATSVGAIGTGEGGDFVVVDDPHKVGEAESEVERTNVLDWWDKEMSTRLNNPAAGGFVIVQQRIHEGDLAGHVLEEQGDDYVHLNLPAEYESKRKCTTVLGWEDPRTEENELLWPDRFGAAAIAKLKRALGSQAAAAQLQQRPAPAEGNMVKRAWFRWYTLPPGGDLFDAWAMDVDEWLASWDMTFKETKDTDFVVGQIWARKGADCYLVDQVRERMDFPTTVKAVIGLSQKWPWVRRKLVEDKANGPAVVSSLKRQIPGLIAEGVQGSKDARLAAVSPLIEAGNVYLPENRPWAEGVVEEVVTFPNAVNDDQVDSMTQALLRLGIRRRKGQRSVIQWG